MSISTDVDEIAEYDAGSIQVLDGLGAVRMRPGMYIGSTGKQGLHHLVWEILDNSVDEAMGGYADKITLSMNDDGSITVEDNGRGIPVAPQEKGSHKGIPSVEVIFTTLHAGGKFDGKSYKYSGGLHGVGTSVVNALSSWLTVQVRRNKKIHEIKFHSGIREVDGVEQIVPGAVLEPVSVIGTYEEGGTGTSVTFLPDKSVFSVSKWDIDLIQRRLRNAAFLNPGITFEIEYNDVSGEAQTTSWCFPNGLLDYMDGISDHRLGTDHDEESDEEAPTATLPKHLLLGGEKVGVGEWEVCLQWFPGVTYTMDSFANGVETNDGGTHVDGLLQSLSRAINKHARTLGFLGDRDPDLDAHDIRSGLSVVLSAKVVEPIFQGQTKNRLGNEDAKSMIRTQFYDRLTSWMEDHPAEIALVIHSAVEEMRTRKRIEAATERERNASEPRGRAPKSEALPSKLRDCKTKDRSEAELFIVEGDSAGGTAERGRNSRTQALLPLRGKVLNINATWPEDDDRKLLEKMEKIQKRMDGNVEIQSMINAIGAGSQDMFDINECRYGKVIIMADADDDGRHIEALVIGIFYRMFKPLIEDGRFHIVQSPLFRTTVKDEPVYAFDVAEREVVDSKNPGLTWTRFKGLGEMDYDQLRDLVMDPAHRRLMRITMDDAIEAEQMVRDMLGGDSTPKWQAVEDTLAESEAAEGISLI